MLAIAPGAPVMSLLAMSSCSSVTAAMMTSATNDGPNATLSRSRAWRVPAARLFTTNVSLLAQAARARRSPARGSDYDGAGPDCCAEDGGGGCTGTCVVGAELDGCGWPYVGKPVGGVGGPPCGPMAEKPP